MEKQTTPLGAFKDALLVGLISLFIFGLIVGVKLKGYSFQTDLTTALSMVAVIFAARLLYNLLHLNPRSAAFIDRYLSQKNLGVMVEEQGEKYSGWVIFLSVAVIAVPLPFFISNYYNVVLIQCMIYVMLGLGLNIVVGWAGMLDLGFVAFYAVGAYTLGLLSVYFGLGFWQTMPIAAVIAAMTGALLGFPVLRMHGDYLAIVTLGFGEIIRLVLNNWIEFTGGPNGINTPRISFFGLSFTESVDGFHAFFGLPYRSSDQMTFIYLVLFLFCSLAVFICLRLKSMPIGRAWEALREDEIACRSMGINHVTVKLAAFMLGATFGGVSGVFFGAYQGFINPTSFTFIESALIVAIVVLGGLGSIPGVIIAAVTLNILPEVFREFENMRVIIFGLVMVIMMVWRPRGLLRIVRPRF